VPTMLLMPFSGHLVLPLFGTFATGLPAALLSVCFAAAWALGGWLNFRLDIRGWWLLVIVILLGTISSVLTFCFHSIADLYRAGNYPPAIIDQMSKLSFFNGPAFAWLMGLVMLPFLGYLIFIRRYFVAR
jgi:fatty acid desaturase